MNFLECFIGLLVLIVAGIVLFLFYLLLHWLCILVFYTHHYGPVLSVSGSVTDMRYDASTTTYNAATKMMDTTPERNNVYFTYGESTGHFDSSTFYQRVRIGDDIKVEYQEHWIEPRIWSGKFEHYDDRILVIYCPRDQSVRFDDEKPVSRKVPTHE